MRRLLVISAVVYCSALLFAQSLFNQSQSPKNESPQTARQALIEMFFGSAPDHLQKHLPDATRKTFDRISKASGLDQLAQFATIASQAKAGGNKLETFDTGPTILSIDNEGTTREKFEITVERDDLIADEDQIELAFRQIHNSKEQSLPFIPRFTFTMKSDADVWRLNEISVSVRVPLADERFLKSMEERSRAQNEQTVIWSLRNVMGAQKTYQPAHASFACSLSELGSSGKPGGGNAGAFFDRELAGGKKNGYVFAISHCDGSHYKVAAEPAASDSGQRSFCSDESGVIRASADGKATSCLSSGKPVDERSVGAAAGLTAVAP